MLTWTLTLPPTPTRTLTLPLPPTLERAHLARLAHDVRHDAAAVLHGVGVGVRVGVGVGVGVRVGLGLGYEEGAAAVRGRVRG